VRWGRLVRRGTAWCLWYTPAPGSLWPWSYRARARSRARRAGPGLARWRDPMGDGGGDCALPASPPWSAKSGRSPRWRARRLQLAAENARHHRFSVEALARGRGRAARERILPNAATTRWRIAAIPLASRAERAGGRARAVAGRVAALPRRRAGLLGNGGCRMRRIMYLWLPRWPDRPVAPFQSEKFRRTG